jgi:CO dehydrogenase nickel-insertion accessory protein CooC1
MLAAVWSPKGGSGTSVVAAALALAVAARVPDVVLADLGGDQPAIFGLPKDGDIGLVDWMVAHAPDEVIDRLACPVTDRIALLSSGSGSLAAQSTLSGTMLTMALRHRCEHVVVDVGRPTSPAAREVIENADISLVVVRGCYMALRRSKHEPLINEATGVVVIDAPERPLRAREVAEVLQLPVLAVVPDRVSIARAVDAGVLPTHCPDLLLEPMQQLVRTLGVGRQAA